MSKRIMVDMSCTIIHHGHIRLLKKASEYGKVVVGLTTDDEIIDKKAHLPEIQYENRKEILESISYVDEVVPVPWLLDEKIMTQYNIDFLVHGSDNSNLISSEKIKIFPRTKGVSSSLIRQNALRSITQFNNNSKLMLTPGPAAVLHENLMNIKPLFGRGDDEYTKMSKDVLNWIKQLSGQDEVITMQGSATLGLELAAHTFVSGRILLVSTGYYSDRLEKLLPKDCHLCICEYKDIESISDDFDWILCAYTETSIAFKLDLNSIKNKADECGAKLYVDATGSIGLEENHHLADVIAFSSCKGLFGLTGASFVAFKSNLKHKKLDTFYFNLKTQEQKMTTGPYHAIASLFGVMKIHDTLRKRVINSKNTILKKYKNIVQVNNQPLLCTYLEGEVVAKDDNIVLYSPRSNLSGSVICHFGEIHHDDVQIHNRIEVK